MTVALTASGERFDQNDLTAAHRNLPLGSEVRVTNLENGRSLTVEINDRGPYVKNRVLDLSKAAARRLGILENGVAKVRIEATQSQLAHGRPLSVPQFWANQPGLKWRLSSACRAASSPVRRQACSMAGVAARVATLGPPVANGPVAAAAPRPVAVALAGHAAIQGGAATRLAVGVVGHEHVLGRSTAVRFSPANHGHLAGSISRGLTK